MQRHGPLDRARLIRVQVELARLPDDVEPPASLQAEEEQLLEAGEKALPRLDGITWGFERGLVGFVQASNPAAFRRHADSIAAVGVVHRVWFDEPDDFAALAEVPAFARITKLAVDSSRPGFLPAGIPRR